jgi:hypothetical protein
MRRLFWVAVGLGLAFLIYRRLEQAKRAAQEAVSPEGLARGLENAWTALNNVADEVQAAARLREAELRRTLLQTD